MPGPRPILIVDDDDTLRQLLVEQLQLEGEFEPIQAVSVADAKRNLTPRERVSMQFCST